MHKITASLLHALVYFDSRLLTCFELCLLTDLLPRLTPILRNRHERVQETTIDLVGRIADRGAEFVSAKEWMRICFELLEMLKAHKKGIRRATVNVRTTLRTLVHAAARNGLAGRALTIVLFVRFFSASDVRLHR